MIFNALRLLAVSFMAALVSAGLIGCAVFSAEAHGAVPEQPQAEMPGVDAQAHHHGMAMTHGAAPDHDPHHGDTSCDGCQNSLLNRAAISLDAGLASFSVPVPVFIIPAAVALDPAPAAPLWRNRWPPGSGPPLTPNTLTHQKISLLI